MNQAGKEHRCPSFEIIMLMMPIFMIDYRVGYFQMKSIVIIILNTGKVDQKEEGLNKRYKE